MSNIAFSRGEKGLSFLLTADTKLLCIVVFADNQWLCVHIFIHIYVCIYVYLHTHTQSQEKADSNLPAWPFNSRLTRSLSEPHLSSSAILHTCVNRNTKSANYNIRTIRLCQRSLCTHFAEMQIPS